MRHLVRRWKVLTATFVLTAVATAAVFYLLPTGHSSHDRLTTVGTAGPVRPGRAASCSADNNSASPSLEQRSDGTFSGCLRVAASPAGPYTVAVSTIIAKAASSTFTTGSASSSSPAQSSATITLQPREGPPGTRVVISGHYPGGPSPGQSGHADACWDGCPGGLMEDGLEVHWGPGGTFSLAMVVPETAWLEEGRAHPLATGTYPVGLECLGPAAKGCALGSGQASAEFHLIAPPPQRCVPRRPCAEVHLGTDHATPGDQVAISGWAPLALIIGTPFGYQADVSAAPGPPLGTQSLKGLASQITVAKAFLRIDPATSWSGLDASHQLWTETAGAGQVAADPADPDRFGYCASGGIQVTVDGGTTFSEVSTAAMAAALAGTADELTGPAPSGCSTLAIDPDHPGSIYASVIVNPKGEAPPFEAVGLLTTDSGQHWSLVPTPPGSSPELFSDFRADRSGVDALFNPSQAAQVASAPNLLPPVLVERSTDGGASWAPAVLGCPGAGSCVTFGGYAVGHCAMHASDQALEYSLDRGATWTAPAWPTTVDSCGLPQLVGLGDGSAVLVDPASGYLVRRSEDGGRDWGLLATPALPGSNPEQADALAGGGTTMLPNGSLLAVPGGGPWYLLAAGSRTWCPLAGTGEAAGAALDSLPVAISGRIWWLRTDQEASGPQVSLMSRPLSGLSCPS